MATVTTTKRVCDIYGTKRGAIENVRIVLERFDPSGAKFFEIHSVQADMGERALARAINLMHTAVSSPKRKPKGGA